jgi:hypothetical protein
VGLVAAALERVGIATVAIQLLRPVAEKVRPPRALVVPFRHGYPLNAPNDPPKQCAVLLAALNLLKDQRLSPPAIVDYTEDVEYDHKLGNYHASQKT